MTDRMRENSAALQRGGAGPAQHHRVACVRDVAAAVDGPDTAERTHRTRRHGNRCGSRWGSWTSRAGTCRGSGASTCPGRAATSVSAVRRKPASRHLLQTLVLSAAGHAHAAAGAVLLHRPRWWRPDVPRRPAARRRGGDPIGARPGQPGRRGGASRSAATRRRSSRNTGWARSRPTGRCARTRTSPSRPTRSATCSWSSTGGRLSSASSPTWKPMVQESRRARAGVRHAHRHLHAALDRTEVACPRLSRHQDRIPARRRQRDPDRPRSPGRSRRTGPGRAISMEKHHLMIGVPRLDGVHGADNLVEAMTAAVQHIAPSNRPSAAGAGAAGADIPARTGPEPARARRATTARAGRCRSGYANRTCRWPTTPCT